MGVISQIGGVCNDKTTKCSVVAGSDPGAGERKDNRQECRDWWVLGADCERSAGRHHGQSPRLDPHPVQDVGVRSN